jgi:DNA-binding transcriptional LysR family regulator
MSQPTVSRHIERMEASIGKELFTRVPRGIEPTETARNLGVYAAQMNDTMYAAQCTLDGTVESTAGTVKAAYPSVKLTSV